MATRPVASRAAINWSLSARVEANRLLLERSIEFEPGVLDASRALELAQALEEIRSLENNLQVKLFTRSHRAVQLTNEGREYLHTVAAILKQLAARVFHQFQKLIFQNFSSFSIPDCFGNCSVLTMTLVLNTSENVFWKLLSQKQGLS